MQIEDRRIEVTGYIAKSFIIALGMHAENMQRQVNGESMAYNDDSFFEQADIIQGAIDVLMSDAKEVSHDK